MLPKLATEFRSLRCIGEGREFVRRNGMIAAVFAGVVREHGWSAYTDSHRQDIVSGQKAPAGVDFSPRLFFEHSLRLGSLLGNGVPGEANGFSGLPPAERGHGLTIVLRCGHLWS
jgi:hypothetical protein